MSAPADSNTRLLTASQLADNLGISRASVYNLINRGMPSLKIGRSRRFCAADCMEFIKSVNATA